MRTIRKRLMAVCMAALLLIPGLAVLAEETPEVETVNEVDIPAVVSGGDAAVETVDAEDVAVVAEDQVMVYADDDIAHGEWGNITWEIDAGGKLIVSGTGDLPLGDRADGGILPWYRDRSQITSAVINVTGMTDASYLFCGCDNMTGIDLRGFDTGNVTNMNLMFANCSGLTSLDVSGINTNVI